MESFRKIGRMRTETPAVKTFGIAIRHAPLAVSPEEKDPKVIENAPITPEGETLITQELVPYLIKKATEDPSRTTILMVHYNKNRQRTEKSALNTIRDTRKALKEAGLSKRVKVRDAKHAPILDTTAPLKARIEMGDTKGGAAINWVMDNEDTQAARGIEPPRSVYARIAAAEAETYRNTMNKQPTVNQKKYPGRVRDKQAPRFSAPQLKDRKVTVIHVGFTHENYHGAILKNVASVQEAMQVDFLEPLEVHPMDRGRGVIYSAPKRNSAYPVNRAISK